MNISKKQKRFLSLAKRMAVQSQYGSIKHGAVLVKGSRIINASYNKGNFCSFGKRFYPHSQGNSTLHAELGCILNLDRSITQGANIYVVRVGPAGNFMISKPCKMCQAALLHVGVKKVYYTNEQGKLESYKL